MKYPHAISCDWLQLHLHKASTFNPAAETNGYNFVDAGYGTKIFKKVYTIIEPGGEVFGSINTEPYSGALHQNIAILKLDNKVLYQSDYIARAFEFIAACDFTYKGVTRVDFCYDCHEYVNGLHPQNLLQKYMDRVYLKIGLNEGALQFKGTYNIKSLKAKAPDEKELGPFGFTGIRWGTRKSGITVNIYNKTKEMADVTEKPYIKDYWRICGLTPEKRTVWRTEISIQNGGKGIKEIASNRLFTLSMDDLITQETIEQMFHTYAQKYCKFVIRDEHAKIQQMTQLKMFSSENEIKMRPKRATKKQNSTRMHKIIINNLNKQIHELAKVDSPTLKTIEMAKDYFVDAYDLEEWNREQEQKLEQKAWAEIAEYDIETEKIEKGTGEYYKRKYTHFADPIAQRAAELRKRRDEDLAKKYWANAGPECTPEAMMEDDNWANMAATEEEFYSWDINEDNDEYDMDVELTPEFFPIRQRPDD